MKINIKNVEIEYESDYPEGWRYADGDAFKFPVTIGNYRCFVRRFEKKSPEDISGWDLLRRMRGKYVSNLVQLYDISTVKENGKDIYYLFYEFLDVGPLDQLLIQRAELDPQGLSDDLFQAVAALQERGFWCSEFFEEQICRSAAGHFHLVKLENTQPFDVRPQFEMPGEKTYWKLVLEFYKQILNQTAAQPAELNGVSLNYLQIPFLILRIRLFYEGKLGNYKAPDLLERLPQAMNEYAAEIAEVFTAAYRSPHQPLSASNIEKLREIIRYKIIPLKIQKPIPPVSKPVIKHFTASKYKVQEKELVTFQWAVLNASKVEILKNGTLLRQFHNLETNTSEPQFFDQNRPDNVFYLRAYQGDVVVDSDLLTIRKSTNGFRKFLKIIAWIIGIIILLFVILLIIGIIMNSRSRSSAYNIYEDPIYEDSVVTIQSEELIDTNGLRVLFNGRQATIWALTGTNLTVAVPDVQDTTSDNPAVVNVSLVKQDKEIFSRLLSYMKKVSVSKVGPSTAFTGDPISIEGKNLNVNGIKVYFNSQEAEVVERQNKLISVKTPDLGEVTSTIACKLFVVNDGDTLKTQTYRWGNTLIHLTDSAVEAEWRTGTSSGNYDLIAPVVLGWQGPEFDPTGFVGIGQITMEDGLNYRVLRTTPSSVPQGSISGTLKQMRVPGRKKFVAKVGFKSLDGSNIPPSAYMDGVDFQVWVHYQVNNAPYKLALLSQHKDMTKSLLDVSVDFPQDVPDIFSLEFRVNAGPIWEADWFAWIDPRVTTQKLLPRGRPFRPNFPFR